MNYYARLLIVILLIVGLAQAIPEVINTLLVLILLSMIVMQSEQFSKMIAQLKL